MIIHVIRFTQRKTSLSIEFPESICDVEKLQHLDASDNYLSDIPSCITSLPLYGLFLARNSLTKLPENIGKMSVLRYLNVQSNQLTILPKSLLQGDQFTANLVILKFLFQQKMIFLI